jgi:hypothetical protein
MSEPVVLDNTNPNYRMIKNFLSPEDFNKVLCDLDSQPEEHWDYEFESVYPKESEVSKDYWTAIKDWKGMSINLFRTDMLTKNGMDAEFYNNIIKKAKQTVEERFGVKVIVEQALLNRWREGREQKPHIDYLIEEEGKDKSPLYEHGMNDAFIDEFKKNFHTKHFSSLIYFNEDFVGGELYFPQHNLEIKPIANSIVSFKGDVEHMHGVKRVESGIRYTISLFWTEIK